MSSIGKEVVEDAAKHPIVDVISSDDILTESVVLQVCLEFPHCSESYGKIVWRNPQMLLFFNDRD